MANYLKGTETITYIRLQNDSYCIVGSDELDIGFISTAATITSVWDANGDVHGNQSNFDRSGPLASNYLIPNRQASYSFTPAAGYMAPAEPLTDVVALDPILEYENSEFDALGVTPTQVIPIRKKFTLSVTRKAQSAFWQSLCLGDQLGNYGSHGVHDTGSAGLGTEGIMTCFEGRIGFPGYDDVGFTIQVYLGKMDNGRYLVLRADNCILRTASMSINAADLNETMFEFIAGSGYYYTVATALSAGDTLDWS